MNIRDLKYLVALADFNHFGKAAKRCFVSQPALSMQIKKLEKLLGVILIERTNKSVLFTDIGKGIVEQARHILAQVEEMHAIAKTAKNPYSGQLKLGIFPTLAPYLLPQIMPGLSKIYKTLSFYLFEEKTSILIEKLCKGELDMAFLAVPLEGKIAKNLTGTLLFEEEFLLATPINHPLAKRKSIRQKDLVEKSLLLLEEGHCLRNQALAICQSNNAYEHQTFRATSLETLRHMISAGIGITLVPKLACIADKNIVYIPFQDSSPQRTIGLFWRKTSAQQDLFINIANQIKKILTQKKIVTIIE